MAKYTPAEISMFVRMGSAYALLREVGFDDRPVKSSDGVEVPLIVDALTVIREESQGFLLLRGPVLAKRDSAGAVIGYTVGNKMTSGDVATDDGMAQINAFFWPLVKAFDGLEACRFMFTRWQAKGGFGDWSSWKGKRVGQHRALAFVVHRSWVLPPKWASAQNNFLPAEPGKKTYFHPLS